ncbi:MAG: class I SAM-dependent methyltransferase [Desulfobacteraceae bacterium]|nr:class I SAM-dependent methyltransferase [Desulfobacteraceae bacterium]
MKHTTCNHCSQTVTEKHRVYCSRDLVLVQCPDCDLVFDIDAGRSFQEKARIGVQKGVEFYCGLKNELVFREELKRIMEKSPPPGRILDFGCGIGRFLKIARDFGYDIYGIEVNEDAIQYINENENFPVYTSIEDAERYLGKEGVDIIYMSHTLEHVSNPKGILKGVSGLLKSSGQIIIIVPNYSFFSKIVDRFHCFLIAKGHQFYFTKETLHNYLEEEFTQIQTHFPIMGGFAMRFLNDRAPIVVKKMVMSVLKFVFAALHRVGLNLNLTIYAQKRE